ncbi:MAG: nucleotidyltransferase family protein [Acidimicrobiia bacterium]|nr:nucleotidyltransferase family protein [Acidimicrobiia bacterium]
MRKAVILAAGKGTRMRDAAGDLPKPMIALAGKPLLEHILDRLREAGFEEALIVTGYRAEVIEAHLAEYPMRLVFRRQEKLDGTARAAGLAGEFAGGEAFLLTFGDIITAAVDYAAMRERLTADAAAVLAVKHVEDPWQGAAVYEEGGVVTRIVEKPERGTSRTNWNSAGSYVFRAELFDVLDRVAVSPRGEYELTSAIAWMLSSGRRVVIHALGEAWRDVGRPEDLAAAEAILERD